MLDIDMNIIEECERIENLENLNLPPPQYARSGKKVYYLDIYRMRGDY